MQLDLSDASAHFRLCGEASETFNPPGAPETEGAIIDGSEAKQLEVEVTLELIDAFLDTLRRFNVSLRLFTGSWEALCSIPSSPLVDSSPYTIVLTSETMYNNDSLDSLIRILQISSTSVNKTVETSGHSTLCLVAGKIVYFGVGGSVSEFMRKVSETSCATTPWGFKPQTATAWEKRHRVA